MSVVVYDKIRAKLCKLFGVPIDLYGVTSNFLASAPIRELIEPVSLAGQLAATIRIGTPVAAREWVILNSPQYFDLGVPGPPEIQSGKHIL